MAKREIVPANVPKTYAELRDAVLAVVVKGRREIDRAWLESYHEIGRLIHVHLLFKKDRAAYGSRVFADLAEESGISKRVLYECVQFFRYFPIVRGHAQLSRSHYQLLCQVPDAKQREALLRQAIKNRWTPDELRPQVRTANAVMIEANGRDSVPPPKVELLKPNRGTPGLHLVVPSTWLRAGETNDGLSVDLGFRHYWPLTSAQTQRFSKGDIVRIAADDSIRLAADATKSALFTYAAQLVRVVDGDTLVVALEVSPGVFLELKLRLRGLDAPEMSTPEGRAAKRFVETLVAKATAVVINTTKPDKYDRYLADVFLSTDSGEIFLNNHLLENGHAVRKDASDFGDDWGFK